MFCSIAGILKKTTVENLLPSKSKGLLEKESSGFDGEDQRNRELRDYRGSVMAKGCSLR